MEHAYGGRIPILKMGEFLLVSIQVDLHDQMAMSLQDDLLEHITRTGARGVLLDISALDVVDSFIGRMVGNIARMSKILGAETVLVSMRPTVAITMVELGVSLQGVHTALNLERGMELLRTLMRKEEKRERDIRGERWNR
ncbi:MAG: STAS domain-containing protein [bacterium]